MHHENTRIYARTLELTKLTKRVCSEFPRGHAFLADQLKRASSGIALNFAEGCGKGTRREQRRFFRIAKGSVQEVAAVFDVALTFEAITEAHHEQGKELCDHLVRMLELFRR